MSGRKNWLLIAEKAGVAAYENKPLCGCCAYGTGGNAECFFTPDTAEKTVALVKILKEEGAPYFFLGAGTNVLVSDDGYAGAVISTAELKGITMNANAVTAAAGEKTEDLVRFALYNSLGGIEFLSGIPATVGGAICMNAGCFGKNAGDLVSCVYADDGIYKNEDCLFSYRDSLFKQSNKGIIAVSFELDNVEFEQSESKIAYFRSLRKTKQPKGRSCGSVFKNDGYFAGKVIESCGLKGLSVGGARVSEKHANFIIAEKNATSEDIYKLIQTIKKRVEENCGIKLSEEVEYIGEFRQNQD